MIEKISSAFVNYQIQKGILPEEEMEIYQYGYIILIETLINMLISCVVAIVFGAIREVAFFLLAFIPIRSYCGGFHAPKSWQCIILSNAVLAAVVLLSDRLGRLKMGDFVYLLAEVVCFVIIVKFAPVDSENKKLNALECRVYKKRAIIVLIVEVITAGVFYYMAWWTFLNILVGVHVVATMSILGAKLLNARIENKIKKMSS